MNDSQKCKFLDEPVNIISCQHIVFLCSSLCFRHITSATLIYSHTYHQKIALNLKLSFCSKSTICFSLPFFLLSNQLLQNAKVNRYSLHRKIKVFSFFSRCDDVLLFKQ